MAAHSVEPSGATATSDTTDRLNLPSSEMLYDSSAGREPVRPLVRRLAALLGHQHRLLTAAQAAVKERERELETARLELRAAEYARDVLEHRLEDVLNATPVPAAGEEGPKLNVDDPAKASWTPGH